MRKSPKFEKLISTYLDQVNARVYTMRWHCQHQPAWFADWVSGTLPSLAGDALIAKISRLTPSSE